MSFDHPKCKAFSRPSHWAFWSAMLAGSFFLAGFSLWQAVNA